MVYAFSRSLPKLTFSFLVAPMASSSSEQYIFLVYDLLLLLLRCVEEYDGRWNPDEVDPKPPIICSKMEERSMFAPVPPP